MKDVRAAWKHAQTAWNHMEAALVSLAEAEAVLLHSLRGAGVAWTKKAKSEINATIKDLDKKRKNATKQFDKLTRRHEVLRKAPVANKAATPGL